MKRPNPLVSLTSAAAMTTGPKPNPTRTEAGLSAAAKVEEHRNVYCGHYNACVNQAVQHDWQGFTCAACPLFTRDSTPRSEAFLRRADAETV